MKTLLITGLTAASVIGSGFLAVTPALAYEQPNIGGSDQHVVVNHDDYGIDRNQDNRGTDWGNRNNDNHNIGTDRTDEHRVITIRHDDRGNRHDDRGNHHQVTIRHDDRGNHHGNRH